MKFTTILLVALSLVFSCSNDHESTPQIVNQWSLIEVYNDPGDGSGSFEPANNDRQLIFFNNGTVEITGSFCPQSAAEPVNTGTYNPDAQTIDPDGCNEVYQGMRYYFEGDFLILEYPCIEPCLEKYSELVVD
jgi:hypothetical protein